MIDIPQMPAIPMDEAGPVFKEPWEAQAFALVLTLHERKCFTWPEWVEALSGVIAEAQRQGDPDLGRTYYRHWLAALEQLVLAKRLAQPGELRRRRAELEANPPDRHGHQPRRDPVRVA